MELTIRLIGGGSSGDLARDLRTWLNHEDELRGRIALVEAPAPPGALGSGVIEAITVGIGSGGAITIAVSGVISWLRQIAGRRDRAERPRVPATIRLEFADGSAAEIVTEVARAWTQAELADQVDRLAAQLGHQLPADGR
jgi:hypothetical protein